MSIISKNKLVFTLLAVMLHCSLTNGAMSRMQSFKQATVGVAAGLRSFASRSYCADQAMRLWESRQKELDALGNIPEKVQKLEHIISRDERNISRGICLAHRYGLYERKNVINNVVKPRLEIEPCVQPYVSHFTEKKLQNIVAWSGVERVEIIRRQFEDEHPFMPYLLSITERAHVRLGSKWLEWLQRDAIEMTENCSTTVAGHLQWLDTVKLDFDVFAGAFIHELCHLDQKHITSFCEILENENEQVSNADLFAIARYFERQADAHVALYGNLDFLRKMTLFLPLLHPPMIQQEMITVEDVAKKLQGKTGLARFPVITQHAHPSDHERIAFFKRESELIEKQKTK